MKREDLHSYQIFAVDHVIHNRYCGLLLDMGLGKTVSTLTALDYLLYGDLDINSVLIVAPKRVVETVWQEEAKKWEHLNRLKIVNIVGNEKERMLAAKAPADIHVVSRDNLAWLVDNYVALKLRFDTLILDELSSFKSNKSLRFKAAKHIRPMMRRVVGLTGTPSPNGLLDLWSQVFLLDRGERLEKTFTTYKNTHFRPGRTNGHIVFTYDLLPGHDEIIHKKIEDICISMKAIDHLQMPERIDNFVIVPIPDTIKKQYDEFESTMVLELLQSINSDLTEIPVLTAAALSNKLLQFANGAVYDENRGVHVIHDLKIKALLEIIEDANGQSVLIAWSYKHDLSRLKEALKEYNPREMKVAQDIADWNSGKIQIMLAHPASAGHGINLQAGGNIIIWFGLTWSLELYLQFNSRLHRQGQKSNVVIIHHLILEGTHDKDVIKAIQSKDRKQENLLTSLKAKLKNYLLWQK